MSTIEERKEKFNKIREKIKKKSEFPYVDEDRGEILCDKCKGSGRINGTDFYQRCSKCNGAGKLDWIEVIVGKNKPKEEELNSIYGNIATSACLNVTAMGGGGGGYGTIGNMRISGDSIDPEFIKGIENKIREQILNEIDDIVKQKVDNELIKRGVKILDDN